MKEEDDDAVGSRKRRRVSTVERKEEELQKRRVDENGEAYDIENGSEDDSLTTPKEANNTNGDAPNDEDTSGYELVSEVRIFKIINFRFSFLPGSIISIHAVNFLSYANAKFYPGPSLNMIIGPNGSGKSAVVCGICLALGGTPSV